MTVARTWVPEPDRLVAPVRTRRARRAAGAVAPEPGGEGWGSGPDGAGRQRIGRPGLPSDVRDAAVEAAGVLLGSDDLRAAVDGVREHVWGLGPLGPLVADPAVTDVLVNGGGQVWVDRGGGPEPAAVRLRDEAEVRALAVRLATLAGRRLDDAMPWVDARLAGGVRLHAVVPPLAPDGTHVSLRVLRPGGLDLQALVDGGTLPPHWAEVLTAVVLRRVAFLVSGGTGAGKTTLLAALLGLVPATERLLLVEDVGELRPLHPHVVRLEARHPNVEGRGAVGLDDLVRQALRMRPDRIVVGECRGAEVRELLAALNTGHAGGCGTVHANACAEVPARLEALGSLAGMSPRALSAQVAAAIDVVIHVERQGGQRRVAEVALVRGDARAGLVVEPALARDDDGRPVHDRAWPALAGLLRLDPVPVLRDGEGAVS